MSDATRFDNPYPGLRPFQFAESRLFFGREKQSEELLRKLRRNRFLTVVGSSGSGKSSLVRAGLLPLLTRGLTADAGVLWRVALFRPGKNPINNMALALNSPDAFQSPRAGGEGGGTSRPEESSQLREAVIETTLRRSALGLADHARRSEWSGRENLLVCVDQFEELFRFKEQSQRSSPEDDAAAFVKLLLEAARDKGVPVYVLLTMRSDFLGECSQFRDLPEAINEGQYLIPRMTRDEQRRAITEPAARRGVEMAPRLAQRLLNDVGDNPDHLPLLQHALMRTWENWAGGRHRGPIDIDHYKAVGGMEDALSNHAQQTYDALPETGPARRIAEKLFKALTETVVNNREVRRPVELGEVCAIAEANEAEVIAVIDHFRDPGRSFLMPPPETALTAETIIDISHESLIGGWKLLKRWVEEEAKSKAMYQRVADAARRRYRQEEGGASLWRDPDLGFAREWRIRQRPNQAWARRYDAQSKHDVQFKEAMAFLKESKDEQKRESREREARLREEREREERERRRELEAAQAEALHQQSLAEVERKRAEEAKGREEAEHARAEEAKRREDAERARAEEAQRLAAAERGRAEEQRMAARQLKRAAFRLRVAVAALVVMLLIASGFAYSAYSEKKVADTNAARADQNAARADKSAKDLAVELDKSRALTNDKEAARKEAVDEKRKADEARQRADEQAKKAEEATVRAKEAQAEAQNNAQELQNTLDQLKSAQQKEQAARDKEQMEQKGLISLEKGEAENARRIFTMLLSSDQNDESREGQIAWTWASYNLGTAYRLDRDYFHAADYYTKALRLQAFIYGRDSLELVPALSRLALVEREDSDYGGSAATYKRLLALLEKPEHKVSADQIANVKAEMAELFHDQARDDRAGAREKESESNALMREVFGLENIGKSSQLTPEQQKKLSEAKDREPRLESEVEILTKESEEKYAEAESRYKEVLEEREQSLPRINPDLSKAYNALAAFYQDQALTYKESGDEKREAEYTSASNKLYELARLVREVKLNPDAKTEDEADRMEALAATYIEHDRYKPAETLLKKSLDIKRDLEEAERKSNPKLPPSLSQVSTLRQLIVSLYEQGQDAEAEQYLDHLIRVLDTVNDQFSMDIKGVDNPYPVRLLASYLGQKKKYAEAEKVIDHFRPIWEKVFRSESDERLSKEQADGLSIEIARAGQYSYKQGKYDAAEKSFNDSIRLVREEFGPDSELDYLATLYLAELYSKQGRYDEALPLFKRVQGIFEKRIGPQQRAARKSKVFENLSIRITRSSYLIPEPESYTDSLSGLAAIHARRGDQDAEALYKELLEASEWIVNNRDSLSIGPRDEKESKKRKDKYEARYADALEAYAAFLEKTGRAAEAKEYKTRAAEIRSELSGDEDDSP
jgi:tetratricopeptide (TPR) repeat protein